VVSGVVGVGIRKVLVLGPACVGAALLAGCAKSGTTSPVTTRTVIVAPSIGTATSKPGFSSTSTRPMAKVFDAIAVQDSVKKILTEDYKIARIKVVTCPAKQEVKEGSTFECAVTVGNDIKKVAITVTSGAGDYQVGTLG
jgi:hypothetical protein